MNDFNDKLITEIRTIEELLDTHEFLFFDANVCLSDFSKSGVHVSKILYEHNNFVTIPDVFDEIRTHMHPEDPILRLVIGNIVHNHDDSTFDRIIESLHIPAQACGVLNYAKRYPFTDIRLIAAAATYSNRHDTALLSADSEMMHLAKAYLSSKEKLSLYRFSHRTKKCSLLNPKT